MLDKKQIWAIFLFKFKMDHKAVETSCNTNNTFGPGAPNEHTVQCGSRSAAKIEPCRGGAQWLAFRSWPRPIQRITETYPLTITWEVDQELDVDHSVVVQHLKQTGKVRNSISELMENQENHHCEVLSFLILCTVMINSVLGPRRSSKAIPKAKFSPKKGYWSLFVGLLPFWSMTTFWILVKWLHLRNMLSKSMRCTKNYNACCLHWLTERAQFFSATMSNCITNVSKAEKLGYKVLPHLQ